jgi:uncharacterized repeat protein (TIGR02543 family)
MVLMSCVVTSFLPKIFYFRGNMKIQIKIMAIFILFFAFAIIACTPGGWGTDKTSTNTVMYNGNTNTDGTVPIDTNTYLPTFTVTVLGNGTLTNTGYTFAGWNTQADGNGTDRAPASTFAIGSSNAVLYAKWTPITCPVNMTYVILLGACVCNHFYVMQSGSCQLCPTGWTYLGEYRSVGDFWSGMCTCVKTKTNSCNQ